ncbi:MULTISPECIES: hypothetical protein [Niallia]|jgi:hypothetical protein|uniref:Uncharacterized protein n=1 Tax=Niallia circulans TaxID=1397 RepID=A0A268FGX6_NIACI|nr:hypothetical protein [Niallia circulans]AYV65843.1 hypothetical protein C2I06_02565 [Niallia circulans]AYV71343.1 hypothetical protein C2H98_06960 [Niallia circulans]NRG30228.1 hypothetical protein [Niallia circulans]PAD84567.1 hypothetical protein CHH57_03990 [Niallia circulans]QJX61740.1 hypothetical protein HLK66_08800 [Niallia circulans]
MNKEIVEEILDKLMKREIESYRVKKEDFLAFRSELVKREDFKHFKGIAEIGGDVTYKYMDEPRS